MVLPSARANLTDAAPLNSQAEHTDAELVNDMDAPLVSPEVAEEFRWKGFGSEGLGRA